MPARSQAQQRFFAMCEHDPAHVKGQCPKGLTKAQLHDFAATPRAGLPKRVTVPTLLDALGKPKRG